MIAYCLPACRKNAIIDHTAVYLEKKNSNNTATVTSHVLFILSFVNVLRCCIVAVWFVTPYMCTTVFLCLLNVLRCAAVYTAVCMIVICTISRSKAIASLLSPAAFTFGADFIADYEYAGIGAGWGNYDDGYYSLRTSIGMMLLDAALYCLLAWYLDKVCVYLYTRYIQLLMLNADNMC